MSTTAPPTQGGPVSPHTPTDGTSLSTWAFNDLEIAITMSFHFLNNSDPDSEEKVSWWRPVAPAPGFCALGDFILPSWQDATNAGYAAMVRDTGQNPATPALKPPSNYKPVGDLVLNNAFWWFWRPIPPTGYVALGLVLTPGVYGDGQVPAPPPPFDPSAPPITSSPPDNDARLETYPVPQVMCLRSDLVVPALIGSPAFGGRGDDQLARLWGTTPQTPPSGMMFFNPGTFVGINSASTDPPASDPCAYSLQIRVPEEPSRGSATPSAPVLAGRWRPQDPTESVSYKVTLPWFAVTDPGMNELIDQYEKSPTYTLERVDTYTCIGFGNNATSAPQQQTLQWETGESGSLAKTFSETTSIEFDLTLGDVFQAKLTQSFTWSTTSTSGWEKTQTVSEITTLPPNTAVAVFVIKSVYNLLRQDGTLVSGGVQYTADNSTMCWAQYPLVPAP